MAEQQRHPWITALVGLVTVEAVAFGGLFLLMLRAEGASIGVEVSALGAAIGGVVLFLALLGGAWCTWRVWSGHWSLGERGTRVVAPRSAPAAAPVSSPPEPRRPEAPPVPAPKPAAAADPPAAPLPLETLPIAQAEGPASRTDEPLVLRFEGAPPEAESPPAPPAG